MQDGLSGEIAMAEADGFSHQQGGLIFKEETSKLLQLDHSLEWC
jgi:hypothetical protein